jgi:hypothetical protein
MINIFFGFWKKFSMGLIAVIVFFCYKNLPDDIAILHNNIGDPIEFIKKQHFFYWVAGVVFFFNFFTIMLHNLTLKIDFSKITILGKWANQPKSFSNLLNGWFDAFLAFANTFIVFTVLGINKINQSKNQTLDFNYNWLLIAGLIIIITLMFFLPLRILFSNPSVDQD